MFPSRIARCFKLDEIRERKFKSPVWLERMVFMHKSLIKHFYLDPNWLSEVPSVSPASLQLEVIAMLGLVSRTGFKFRQIIIDIRASCCPTPLKLIRLLKESGVLFAACFRYAVMPVTP